MNDIMNKSFDDDEEDERYNQERFMKKRYESLENHIIHPNFLNNRRGSNGSSSDDDIDKDKAENKTAFIRNSLNSPKSEQKIDY